MLTIQSKHEWAFLKSKAGFGQLVLYSSISKRIVCFASCNMINVKHLIIHQHNLLQFIDSFKVLYVILSLSIIINY